MKNQENIALNEKRQVTAGNTYMTQMLELFEQDFQEAVKKSLNNQLWKLLEQIKIRKYQRVRRF